MVIIGTRHSISPPPQMIPISWMPLKCVSDIARNAPAVVSAPVKIPWPVNTIAFVSASTSVLPWRNPSS